MLIISEETLSSHLKLGHHGNCTQKSSSPPLFARTYGPQRSWEIWKCKTATVQAITSLVSTTVNIMRGGEWRRIPLRIWHLICLMLDIERHRAVNNVLNTQNTPNQKSLWAIAFLYIQFYVRGLTMSLQPIIRILSKKKVLWTELSIMSWLLIGFWLKQMLFDILLHPQDWIILEGTSFIGGWGRKTWHDSFSSAYRHATRYNTMAAASPH